MASFLLANGMLVCIVNELPVEAALEQIGVVADALLKGTYFGGFQEVRTQRSGEMGRSFGRDNYVDGFVIACVWCIGVVVD